MRKAPRYDIEVEPDGSLVTWRRPPTYQPVTATTTGLAGARVVVIQATEWWVDLRALTDPYTAGGDLLVDLADEGAWYAADGDRTLIPAPCRGTFRAADVYAELARGCSDAPVAGSASAPA